LLPQGIDSVTGLVLAAADFLVAHRAVESLVVGKLPEHTEGVVLGLKFAQEQ